LNCKKPRLRKLVLMLLNKEVSELHLTHKDRLIRFGHELIFQLCKWSGANVITLMTVFSARLYGKRSHQNRNKNKQIQKAA
jgi:putative resolvase